MHHNPIPPLSGVCATAESRATDPGVTEKQRIELDAWKASQLAKAPSMDEATARRVSVALFGSAA